MKEDLVKTTQSLFKISKSQQEIDTFLKLNKRNEVIILQKLHSTDLSVGEKSKLENILALLKSLSKQIKRKQTSGQGIGPSTSASNSTNTTSNSPSVVWKMISSAFRSRIQTGAIINLNCIELDQFLEESRPLLKTKIIQNLKTLGPIKLNVKLCATYELPSTGEEDYKYFVSCNKEILKVDSIDEIIKQLFETILSKSEEFQHRGSGWKYVGTSFLLVCINKFSPLNGVTYIALPSWLESKGLINIKNNDKRCFVWSILAHLYHVDVDKENVLSYPQSVHDILNLRDIEMPVKISDISKFENQNPNISINVFGIDSSSKSIIGPLYHTKQVKPHHINLLYFKIR
ncbi:uncharacterized protein LOC126734659 [Anthonomus grandis grandis]|uniref:uncharacterized protein LOC126734659 n=1 Tax=Anthonomus grandis grandis TaxID=2921223 RepID=UPI002165F32F|nr:uncharacterized protein LOC126734659 [Anthonomus grandis grandis]